MNLIIYFLRHGETTASQTDSYCGTLDPDLTLEGHQMAEDLRLPINLFHGSPSFPVLYAVLYPLPDLFARRQEYECGSNKG